MNVEVYEMHESSIDRYQPPIDVVSVTDFDRVTAERDALQQLLNARDEEVDKLRALASKARSELKAIKAAVGFRAETLQVIGALDMALENQA